MQTERQMAASQKRNRVTGHRVSDFGRVGSRVSVSDPVFDLVLSFNMFLALFYRVSPSRHNISA